MHQIFRKEPDLFARLLPRAGIAFPEYHSIESLDTDLTEIRPLEREIGLGEGPARDYWRKPMDAYTPVFPGGGSVMEEAWRKVHADGEAKGEVRGQAKGEAKAVLRVLGARGVEVSEAVRERVMACADLEVLETWLDRSLSVARAEELFVGERGEQGP
ncbi:hypothetical protein [Streptomyces misionensis]